MSEAVIFDFDVTLFEAAERFVVRSTAPWQKADATPFRQRHSSEPIALWIVLRGETRGRNAGRSKNLQNATETPRFPPPHPSRQPPNSALGIDLLPPRPLFSEFRTALTGSELA